MIERIFNIVIEKEEDEKEYFIHCPQLQGCSSQGGSIEDALLNFSEALALYMEITIEGKLKL
ncbi:hypothetical protein ES705_33694 [subsurface metagenome]